MRRIRPQLFLLVAGALLPLVAFVGWTLHGQHRDLHTHMDKEAVELAKLARAAIDEHLNLAEGVLASLAPLAARDAGAISQPDLESVMRRLPAYATNLITYDAAGRLLSAHFVPSERALREGIREETYYREALELPGVAISSTVIGRKTGKRLLKTALAYRDARGKVAGVIVMTTSLATFEAQLLEPLVDNNLNVAVLDHGGHVIMRSKGWGDALAQPEEVGRGLRAARAPLTVVARPDDDFMRGQHQRYVFLLLAVFAAIAVGLGYALVVSRRISQPLFTLHRAAETLGRGELRHRVPALGGEAGDVGRAFNMMAAQLESQRATIRADVERFRGVFDHCPLPMAISDVDSGELLEVNSAFEEVTGRAAKDLIGKTSAQIDFWVDPQQRNHVLQNVKRRGRVEAFECQHRMRDGRIADFLLYAELMTMAGRRVILFQGVDVTERKRMERQVRDVSKRLALATRSSRVGVWDLDLRSRSLTWDDTMFDLFRVAPQDFGGRFENWLRYVPREDRADVEKCRLEAVGAANELEIQYRAVLADGSLRYMSSSASVERDPQGQPVRLLGTTRDVTETVLGREALARANSELEARVVERTGELQETVRELEAFSYTVAHDLRAPLRAIDGFSSYLGQSLTGGDGPEATALLSKIRRNVGSMDRLIDGLLNYARLGRQSLRSVRVDMNELVASVRGGLAAAYPGVEITVDCLPDAIGDPDMLRQVWANLMSNACKFSRARSASRVAIGSTPHAEGTVYFVWDNGVGFDMRYSDRLFRVFERLHTDPEFGGTGVGLAVVQRIMQRHAGTVWAEGFPGEGATFYFRLPDNRAE